MKTDELISLLAADPAPEPNTVTRRFTVALALGIVGAYLLMVWTHGVRADLAQATVEAMFWGKLIFAGSLAFAALIATQRLGHPGVAGCGACATFQFDPGRDLEYLCLQHCNDLGATVPGDALGLARSCPDSACSGWRQRRLAGRIAQHNGVCAALS